MILKRLLAWTFAAAVLVSCVAWGQLRLADLAPGGDDDDVIMTGNLDLVGILGSRAACAAPDRRALPGAPVSSPMNRGRHAPAEVFRPPIVRLAVI